MPTFVNEVPYSGKFSEGRFSEILEISYDFQKYIFKMCFMALLKYFTVKRYHAKKPVQNIYLMLVVHWRLQRLVVLLLPLIQM